MTYNQYAYDTACNAYPSAQRKTVAYNENWKQQSATNETVTYHLSP